MMDQMSQISQSEGQISYDPGFMDGLEGLEYVPRFENDKHLRGLHLDGYIRGTKVRVLHNVYIARALRDAAQGAL